MKEATLQTLITARALLEQVERHCSLGDRYMATAGLIVLQDAVELVLFAALIEKGIDDDCPIEKFSFDEMISALGKVGVKVPKSGTLKAMNKLRVAAKHYGQVMEPLTVQGHLNAAKHSLDSVLVSVIGKPLREVFLIELIGKTRSLPLLESAVTFLERGEYLEALIATRKAFFVEFEKDYCIYEHRNAGGSQKFKGGLLGLVNSGWKAPYWTRDADWISKKVQTPFDYIQIDHENWRVDAIEWGINTQTLNNIRRLTPEVIQLEWNGDWLTKFPAAYPANSANRDNAASCLDLTIEVIRRKHEHIRSARVASEDKPYDTPPAYVGQPLLNRPDLKSNVVRILEEHDKYVVHEILDGFSPSKTFYRISCTTADGKTALGYIERRKEEPLTEGQPTESSESAATSCGEDGTSDKNR
ncbi:MAG: hypothetical protein CVU18_07010 [Betaproteobacteria bacterium HGW-Betaproteobacteria-12]|nr:MAG: hypothetical protein CVU18_07010 [Betaproteobacteria bacterium HGW-Betaproteobacteria-12]